MHTIALLEVRGQHIEVSFSLPQCRSQGWIEIRPGDNCFYLLSHLQGTIMEFFLKPKDNLFISACVPKR